MKKVKTSQRGRKCKFPLCKHTLSIYNHQDYCHIHLGYVDMIQKPKESKYHGT
jgi:hypothetical protein